MRGRSGAFADGIVAGDGDFQLGAGGLRGLDDLCLGSALKLWQKYAMSTLTELDPKQLRPLLHAEIDRLRDEDVALLHRVALQLELEEVSGRLDAGFAADRAAGKLARLPELVREARAALRQHATP